MQTDGIYGGNVWQRQIKPYLYLVIGAALFAVGDVMFVNPYMLAPGGTYGLANVLNILWPWRISYYAICIDVPILLVGFLVLGRKFGVKTIAAMLLIFVFTWILENTWGYEPVIHNGIFEKGYGDNFTSVNVRITGSDLWFSPDYFLNTLLAGVIYGLSTGLIFKSSATADGSDIVSMILHKYTKISFGTAILIVDMAITLTSFIAFHQLRLPIYSMLIIFIQSKVIDVVVDGLKYYRTVFIVTDKVDEVSSFIINDIKRGGTCFKGRGMYSGAERDMVYVSLTRFDLVKLKSKLHLIDPDAFVNIVESAEIMGRGRGFKALKGQDE